MDPEVVIIDGAGTEHVFPAGFDPQKAAEIVRGQATPTPGAQARKQGNEDMGSYLAQTLRNIPADLVNQGKGVIGVLSTLAGATGELGSDIGNTVRQTVGLTPYYQPSRPNQEALKAIPGAILQHYAGYLDPEQRALQVRDHPVGTALDLYGATKTAQAVAPAAKAAVGAAGSAVLDRVPGLGAMRKLGRVADSLVEATSAPSSVDPELMKPVPPAADLLEQAIQRGLAKGDTAHNAELARLRAVPAEPPAAAPSWPQIAPSHARTPSASSTPSPQASLAQQMLMREPDWRTVDAVPIRAMETPGILYPGESRVGLAEAAAQASKTGNAAEVEALLKALRQRMNISRKSGRP